MTEVEEKTNRRKNEIVDVGEKQVKLVIFTLSGSCYAFHSEDIKEILPLSKIYYIPGSPRYILGILNVRGDIQSIIDLNLFLGFSKTRQSEASRVIIVEKNGIGTGILSDTVEDVFDVPISTIQKNLTKTNENIRSFVSAETTYRGKPVAILDLEKLFVKMTAE